MCRCGLRGTPCPEGIDAISTPPRIFLGIGLLGAFLAGAFLKLETFPPSTALVVTGLASAALVVLAAWPSPTRWPALGAAALAAVGWASWLPQSLHPSEEIAYINILGVLALFGTVALAGVGLVTLLSPTGTRPFP